MSRIKPETFATDYTTAGQKSVYSVPQKGIDRGGRFLLHCATKAFHPTKNSATRFGKCTSVFQLKNLYCSSLTFEGRRPLIDHGNRANARNLWNRKLGRWLL